MELSGTTYHDKKLRKFNILSFTSVLYRHSHFFRAVLVSTLTVLSFVFAQDEKYVEIKEFYAKVYSSQNATSKPLGVAKKGEKFYLLSDGDQWIAIKYENATGWIFKGNVKIVSVPKGSQQIASKPEPVINSNNTQSQTTENQLTSQDSQLTAAPDKSALDSSRTANVQAQQTNLADSQKVKSIQTTNSEKSNNTFFKRKRDNQLPKPTTSQKSNWFTKNNLPNLPSNPNSDESNEEKQLYFQVITTPTSVFYELNPTSPLIGIVKKGDNLLLIGEGSTWCKVAFRDTVGWVQKRNGKIVTSTNQNSFEIRSILILFACIAFIALLIIVYTIIKKIKTAKINSLGIKKTVLIIAKQSKTINYTLTDTNTSLERCFTEIGFEILVSKEISTARNHVDHHLPDIVLIDWQFDRNALVMTEHLFSQRTSTANALFIFYNVPNPESIPPSKILHNVHYLGSVLTDRDIFKLITPLIITSEKAQTIQKSVKSAALEGEIAGGNLLEVLQFIEIGRKTGCLLVDTGHPFGLIYFTSGRIVYAAAENLDGRDAVYSILNLKSGKFRFVLDKIPKTTNVNLSTLEVLMEWTKALDEAHGH